LTKKEIKEVKDMDRSLYAIEYNQAHDRQKYIRPESIKTYVWPAEQNICGSKNHLINCLVQAMRKVHDDIKSWFFHPNWKEKRVHWRSNMDKYVGVFWP